MFHESIKFIDGSNNNLAPAINFNDTKIQVKFDGNCLTQDRLTFAQKKIVNTYIVYQIIFPPYILGTDFAIGNSLFGTIKFPKNADPDKFKYYGYGIELMHVEIFCYQMVVGLVKMLYLVLI